MSAEGHTIPEDTAAHYARLINEAEAMRQAGADALKSAYADLRSDLKQLGWGGASISAEIAAFKGAIAEMNLAEAEKSKREAKGERIDEYVFILSRARALARENIEEFDPITGEFLDDQPASNGEKAVRPEPAASSVGEIAVSIQPETANESPRKAAEAVSERTRITDATVASALVEADKAEAVAGELRQPETIPALTGQFPGVNVDGPERAGVTGGESAATTSIRPAPLTGSGGNPGIPSSDDGGAKTVEHASAQPGRTGEALGNVHTQSEQATNTNSEPTPASQGEAEVPSVECEQTAILAEDSSAAANTGGDHVDPQDFAATHQAGGVSVTPATHPLRPNCLNPSNCAGYGSNHCHSCKVAMREGEAA